MKKVLTIAVFADGMQKKQPMFDRLELIFHNKGEKGTDFLSRCSKNAKGKYIILAERLFTFGDVHNFCDALESANQDAVLFDGGAAFKLSVLKGVDFKTCGDAFCAKELTLLNCKTVLKTRLTPLIFKGELPQTECEALKTVCSEFQKVKGKLNKDVYANAFDTIVDRLVHFYIRSILAVREGTLEPEKLIEFDKKLKSMIVLYLALEQKFPVSNLQKFRDKEFKISGLTARKLKKYL